MTVRILHGDALAMLKTLESESVQVVCTSPPYFGLRDYGTDGQIGLEQTPAEFIARLVAVFDEVKRVLHPSGLVFCNLGPSYAGSGKGPTGKNGIGNQAKRQGFVGDAATSDQSRSRALGRAPAYGIGDRAPSGYRGIDSAYSDLCDGCLADFLSRLPDTPDTSPQQQPDAPLLSTTGRDSEPLDSSLAIPGASAHDALASTTLESWRLLRGACSRCASRAASFVRLGQWQDALAIRESAHTTASPSFARSTSDAMQDQHGRRYDKGEIAGASVDCIEDTAAGSFSYQYFSRLDRQRKAKSLILIPEMFALAMEEAGWTVRQQIVWAKKAPMPESVRDRFTRSWESIWMFSKSRTYFFDQEAVRVPGASDWANGKRGGSLMREHDPLNAWQESGSGFHRTGTRPPSANPDGANMRDVWWLSPEPSSLNHYASFVTEIPKRCILAGTSQRGQCPACGTPWARVVEKGPLVGRRARPGQPAHLTPQGYLRAGGSRCGVNDGGMTTTGWAPSCSCNAGEPVPQTVLDPFLGSGTTLLVASRLGRDGIGIELNPDYVRLAEDRIRRDVGPMFPDEVEAAAPAPPRSLDLFALIDAEEAV